MPATPLPTRRNAVFGIAGATLAAAFACPALAQASPRVAVIGGGFGGASCARALKRLDRKIEVTLIEANRTFVSCPFSNEVIAGLREFEAQQFGYDRIAADGVKVLASAATRIDPQARTIGLADGNSLTYDRLVLAPGIDMRFDALPGYDEAASARMPHAWKAGEQTLLLKHQLEAMKDGGVVVIAVPAAPLRCPPAPYERASLIAHYLKASKPRSKVLVLDAKDSYSQQRLFEAAWKELYPGMIERIALSQGGRVTSVDASTSTIVTEFGNYSADVANVIPPQKAGRIAEVAGAADHTGWCPIDPNSFASKLVPNVHVIGDACIAGGIPKSAGAAAAQGKACATVIVGQLAGKAPEPPRLTGACYNTVAPAYGFSLSGIYQPRGDQFAEVEVRTSPVEASREIRAQEAESALSWFRTITGETFG
ncbi:MAG: FAD-dependent oxidoreductase [Bradyrhizobium sp.]|nr:FAD-dependent oxidoreductase [Bradyrhizobium sp.]